MPTDNPLISSSLLKYRGKMNIKFCSFKLLMTFARFSLFFGLCHINVASTSVIVMVGDNVVS